MISNMANKYEISPVVALAAQRCRNKKVHKYDRLRSTQDIDNTLRLKRKAFLGSGLALEPFVRKDGKPLVQAVELLSQYLGKQTALFLKDNEYSETEQFCQEFYHHCLQLYAYGSIGDDSFDDLIQLAEVYVQQPEILAIIADDDLPEDISLAWKEWLHEHSQAPFGFVSATTGALAVLLGVLPELSAIQ